VLYRVIDYSTSATLVIDYSTSASYLCNTHASLVSAV
jgi:hypothetical protein